MAWRRAKQWTSVQQSLNISPTHLRTPHTTTNSSEHVHHKVSNAYDRTSRKQVPRNYAKCTQRVLTKCSTTTLKPQPKNKTGTTTQRSTSVTTIGFICVRTWILPIFKLDWFDLCFRNLAGYVSWLVDAPVFMTSGSLHQDVFGNCWHFQNLLDTFQHLQMCVCDCFDTLLRDIVGHFPKHCVRQVRASVGTRSTPWARLKDLLGHLLHSLLKLVEADFRPSFNVCFIL